MSEIEQDIGPLARFEKLKGDSSAPGEIFRLLTDVEGPRSLREIARLWGVARGAFVEWYMREHVGLYDAAMKVRADELAHDALSIADEQHEVVDRKGKKFDPEVPRDKLRVDTRLKVASRWDRERYGERPVDTLGSIENLAQALQRISEKKHRELRAVQNATATDAEVIELKPRSLPAPVMVSSDPYGGGI